MTLSDFEYLVKFKYQIKTATEASDELSLTDMFLALTGITYLTKDIEDLYEEFEDNKEKEKFLNKLAWCIAGGASTSDVKFDVNKDTKLTKEDVDLVKEISDKDEQSEEEIEKADMNKDGKVDDKDIQIIEDNIKSEAEPQVEPKPEEPTTIPFTIVRS